MQNRTHISLLNTLTLLGILCLLSSFAFQPQHKNNNTLKSNFKWGIQRNSSITIKGSSNVNTFGCSSSGNFKSETLHGTIKPNQSIEMKGSVTIDIHSIDCNNRILTNDLRKTLKAEEYPNMKIHFKSLERIPIASDGEDFVGGNVIIELAGTKKSFYLRYSFVQTKEGITLSGSRAFSFADFDLSPPQKAGGLIKVKDDFDVAFTLVIKDLP